MFILNVLLIFFYSITGEEEKAQEEVKDAVAAEQTVEDAPQDMEDTLEDEQEDSKDEEESDEENPKEDEADEEEVEDEESKDVQEQDQEENGKYILSLSQSFVTTNLLKLVL